MITYSFFFFFNILCVNNPGAEDWYRKQQRTEARVAMVLQRLMVLLALSALRGNISEREMT